MAVSETECCLQVRTTGLEALDAQVLLFDIVRGTTVDDLLVPASLAPPLSSLSLSSFVLAPVSCLFIALLLS